MPVGKYENFDACVADHIDKGHTDEEARKICGKMEKDMRGGEMESATVEVNGRQFAVVRAAASAVDGDDAVRWNVSQSGEFDVHLEHLEASTLVYDWVSRFIQVPVKKLFENNVSIPSVHVGSFLSALEEITANDRLEDMRNIAGGREEPPVYEVIELNAENSRDFLIQGIQFFERKSGVKYVIARSPSWYGVRLTVYTSVKDRAANAELVEEAWRIATERSFLKGAAFSISGKFLKRGDETWNDVFLDPKQQRPLERLVETVNERGAAMDNRGIAMMGPPGTGKTLAARVIKNQANATFIWVSARDFYRLGTFGGLSQAFDLARLFAPSIVTLEDVDNWLDHHSIDFLKTEMDGIDQSKGVSVLLTTNFPERFPDALIDRPGRFHEVIQIGLPDENVRARMLARWVPGASKATIASIAKETEGLSGAHIKELARFAETLASEQDGLSIDAAVTQALAKVIEQRELIAKRHLSSSRAAKPERLSPATGITFNPAITYQQAALAAANKQAEVTMKANGHAPEASASAASKSADDRDKQIKLVHADDILQRIASSSHPHNPIGGYPFVDDVDTVSQVGSWRSSDMSIEFVAVTRRGDERNRNGSLVQIVEGNGFKGLKTEFWEAHRGTWLFGHGLMPGFMMPIGNSFNRKTERVEFNKTKFRMTARLFLSQRLAEAAIIADLLEEGVLNCSSVQFLPEVGRELEPVTMEAPEDTDPANLVAFGRPLPFEFLQSDLFEISVVPIPADAHAIRKGVELGKIGETKIALCLKPHEVRQSLQLMAGDTPAQSGWTPARSPKAAEFRYYQSIGDWSSEIVAPTAEGLIAVMDAAGIAHPEDVKDKVPPVSQEPTIDYEALASLVRNGSGYVKPQEDVPAIDTDAVRQTIAEMFGPLAARMERQEAALRQLTGAID